jgi:peptide/nickel transport system permease protein
MKENHNLIRNYILKFTNIFRISKKFEIGFILLLCMIILSFLEPTINFYRIGRSPERVFQFDRYLPISYEHPLGTDRLGRDELALLLIGLKNSLIMGGITGILATLIAVIVAVIGGYLGGKWDDFLNSITNAILIIPSLPILIVAAIYVRLDLTVMSVLLTIFIWPWAARTIRAQILSLKERPFIDLSKVSGFSSLEIMFKDIIPNLAPYIGVAFSYTVIGAILTETGLRVIGLGPGYLISLGYLINDVIEKGLISMRVYNIVIPPILLLVLIFVALNLINIGLEESFNPRLKKITGA